MSVDLSAPSAIHVDSTRRRVLHELMHDHPTQLIFVLTAAIVGVAYSVLLPFGFTQRITWRNWHYLDARYVAFSVAFGLATGWMVAAQTFAMRRVAAQRGAAIGGTGAVLGLVPSFLCCTPIVPTILGFVGLSGASLARTSGRTQYFFETRQNLILAASLAVVLLADLWTARRIVRSECFADGCTLSASDPGEEAGQ